MKSGMNCIRDVERIFGIFIRRCIFEKCIAPGIEVEKQSQVLEEKLAERCKLAKGRPCVDFKVVDVNGKEGMFSDYVKPGKYNMLEVWALWCGHCRVVIPH